MIMLVTMEMRHLEEGGDEMVHIENSNFNIVFGQFVSIGIR